MAAITGSDCDCLVMRLPAMRYSLLNLDAEPATLYLLFLLQSSSPSQTYQRQMLAYFRPVIVPARPGSFPISGRLLQPIACNTIVARLISGSSLRAAQHL